MSKPCVYVIFQRLNRLFYIQLAAVDRQIVMTGIAPFYLTMTIVVRLSATVLLDHTLFRMTGIQLIDLHDTFDLGLPVSQYEDGDQVRIRSQRIPLLPPFS